MTSHAAPLANIVTLGVRDYAGEREFYRRMGWPQVFDSDEFAVFELSGAVLALFPVDKLAADSRSKPAPASSGIRFSIIITADTPDDVDRLIEQARQAGGTVTKEPVEAEFFVGRDAYFCDPEGNFWEVAWAPPDNPVTVAARRAATSGLNQ
jgi:uncharacterized protein